MVSLRETEEVYMEPLYTFLKLSGSKNQFKMSKFKKNHWMV